jgi:hypothetical protein
VIDSSHPAENFPGFLQEEPNNNYISAPKISAFEDPRIQRIPDSMLSSALGHFLTHTEIDAVREKLQDAVRKSIGSGPDAKQAVLLDLDECIINFDKNRSSVSDCTRITEAQDSEENRVKNSE